MISSSKSKIAVTLLSTFAFGLNNSVNGANEFQGDLATVRAVSQAKKSLLAPKIITGVLGSAVVLEAIHSWVGFKTDSVIGTGSIGRVIKNYNKRDDINFDIRAKIEENKGKILDSLKYAPFGQTWLAQAANDFFDTASKNLELFNTEKFTSLTKMLKGEVSVYSCRVISIQNENLFCSPYTYYLSIVIQKSDNQFVEYIVKPEDDSFVVFANPEISKEKAKERMEAFLEKDDDCPKFDKFSSVKLKFTDKLEFVDTKNEQAAEQKKWLNRQKENQICFL